MTMITKASTNVVRYFMMRLVADGTAATGLTATTFDIQYTRELTASATPAAGIVGTGGATTHVDNKVFELDATNSPGLYMVCFPDAAFATGVDQVTLNVTYDATVFTEAQNIQLVDFNPFDVVRMGMTALPNAAADAAGGLPISAAGGLDLDSRIQTDIPAILVDTAEIGIAGAGLSNINLPNQTMDITGNITGNLSGSIGSNIELGPTEVNAQVVDAISTDTISALSQGAPPLNPTLEQAVMYLYTEWVRNKVVIDTNTANQKQVFADNGSTILYEKDLTNASNITTIAEALTGA